MSDGLAREAGSALVWRAVQLLAGKGVSLVRTLVLARLLVPNDFGLMVIAAVSVEMLLSLSDFGMEPALVQRSDVDRTHYDAAWSVRMVRALFVALILIAVAGVVASVFGEPAAAPLIRVLALRPLIDAASSIRTADLTRHLRFRSLAFVGLAGSIAEAVAAILLASSLGVWALVAGALIGSTVGLFASYVAAPYRPRLRLARQAAAPLFRFGRWVFITGVVGVVGGVVLQAVITRRLGVEQLGLYYLAASLAFLPNDVASSIMTEVAFPVHARLQRDLPRASRAFMVSVTATLGFIAPIYCVLIALAPSVVEQVLGEEWAGTSPIIRVLAVAGIIGVIADGAMPMLKGIGHPERVAFLYALRSVLVLALVGAFIGRYALVGAALAWLAAEAGVQIAAASFAVGLLPRPFSGFWRRVGGIAIASLAGGFAAFALDGVTDSLVGLIGAAATGLLVAAGTLWILDQRLALGLRADVGRVFPGMRGILPSRSPDPPRPD